MKQPLHETSLLTKLLNVLAWVLIAALLVATLFAVQWAARQPKVHSIWGEPSEKPLSGNSGGDEERVTFDAAVLRVFKGHK